jgi:hypothetical protein
MQIQLVKVGPVVKMHNQQNGVGQHSGRAKKFPFDFFRVTDFFVTNIMSMMDC